MTRAERSFFDKVYLIVRQIPRGKVAYYGQVAEILGAPGAARTVGWALAALPSKQSQIVPWQRVINKAGRCSIRSLSHSAAEQQALLEEEGVVFDESGYTDFAQFGWEGLSPDEARDLLAATTGEPEDGWGIK